MNPSLRPVRALAAFALLATFASARPARAGGCYVILPNTIEACTNGMQFLVRAFDACGAGQTMHAGLWNGFDNVYGTSHLFVAQGDLHRYRLSYPGVGHQAGDPVTINVSEDPSELGGSFGTSLGTTLEDCRLLDPIETTNVWNGVGTVGILNDSLFDYDGDGTDTDAAGFGPFRLLSTARSTPFDTSANVDASKANEWDIAKVSQTFAPRDPCHPAFKLALYTNDTVIDDLAWYEVDETIVAGFSLPAIASSTFVDWPVPLDGIARAAPAAGGDLGAVGYSQGGGLVEAMDVLPLGGDGASHSIGFAVADEGDHLFDSALALARVRCETTLLFAAGFELFFLEWDGVVGQAVP